MNNVTATSVKSSARGFIFNGVGRKLGRTVRNYGGFHRVAQSVPLHLKHSCLKE